MSYFQINRLLLGWVFAAASALAGSPANTGSGLINVVPPGTYHASEVPYEAGPGWLALVPKSSTLVPVNIRISVEYDPVSDPEDGPYSGKVVSGYPATNAVVLLQGSALKEGPLITAEVTGDYSGLSSKIIIFGDKRYTLHLGAACNRASEQCDWLLSDGSTQQLVGRLRGWFENTTFVTEASSTGLLWAGDLDRDGKLDLMVDVSDHYNAVAKVMLLLSSTATGDQLVGEIATFSAVGC